MKIEKKIVLKVEIDEKSYSFICEDASPLGAIWDSLNQMSSVISSQIKEANEASNQPEDKESVEPEKTDGE